MSEKYKVVDSSRPTFITLTIIDWVDLFTRKRYCQLMDDSLNYCVKEKGLIIHAFVYMSNHIHLIVTTKTDNLPQIIRDFKTFTSKQFIKLIKEPGESRREWLLNKFSFAADRIKRNSNYKVWKDGFHPVILDTNFKVQQRVEYVHYNPVAAGICHDEAHYANSSYLAYTDEKIVRINLPVVALY
jgi:REP element-mobilizing transposase RayT